MSDAPKFNKVTAEIIDVLGQFITQIKSLPSEHVGKRLWDAKNLLTATQEIMWIYEDARWEAEYAKKSKAVASYKDLGLSLTKASFTSTHYTNDKGEVCFEITSASTTKEEDALYEEYINFALACSATPSQTVIDEAAKSFGKYKEYIQSNSSHITKPSAPRFVNMAMLHTSAKAGKLDAQGTKELSESPCLKELTLANGSTVLIKKIGQNEPVYSKTDHGISKLENGTITLADQVKIKVENGVMSEIDGSNADFS